MPLLWILVSHIIRLHQVLVLGVFFNFFWGASRPPLFSQRRLNMICHRPHSCCCGILYGLTSRIYLPCDLLYAGFSSNGHSKIQVHWFRKAHYIWLNFVNSDRLNPACRHFWRLIKSSYHFCSPSNDRKVGKMRGKRDMRIVCYFHTRKSVFRARK